MTPFKRNLLAQFPSETLVLWLLRLMALICGAILLLIVIFLGWEAFPIFKQIGLVNFFTDASWHPTAGQYNLIPMLLGTILTSLGAILVATPAGIISAIFTHYYAPSAIAPVYRRLIELLAGIPSVVYGFWGLVVLVPLINKIQSPGASLLAGICILSIMILPTVALVTDSSFANVPEVYLSSAKALGLGRWAIVWGIVLPASKSGIVAGIVLATGRALGETMAVVMVCGNVVQVPNSLFDPVRTLTANIALEMGYALADHRAALFFSGLMLMALVAVLIGFGRTQTES